MYILVVEQIYCHFVAFFISRRKLASHQVRKERRSVKYLVIKHILIKRIECASSEDSRARLNITRREIGLNPLRGNSRAHRDAVYLLEQQRQTHNSLKPNRRPTNYKTVEAFMRKL